MYLFSVKAGQSTPDQSHQVDVISIHDGDVTTHYLKIDEGETADAVAIDFVTGGGLGRCDEKMVLEKSPGRRYSVELCQDELWIEDEDGSFEYDLEKHDGALSLI